ncbi:hypothetical protein LIER_23988 [Lithospermum erythrorhizon]|uniref:Gag-pol polyprotein n=1 Tax=Lithospermum erythrorhizon TaxID=34254 RepID=A0AAV3R0Q1_LITER
MEGFKEGCSITRPPVLDRTNYTYWKARITPFLKSMDTRTWKAIPIGWTTPTVTNDNLTTVKPEDDWTGEQQELALRNDKALNAIFNVVDLNLFKLINTCTVAKVAWDSLQTAYEGTVKIKGHC